MYSSRTCANEFEQEAEMTQAQALAGEKYRQEWEEFVRKTDKKLKESWLWQYWKSENRAQSQVSKFILGGFDSRLRAQKKVKKLIRSGVPPAFRSQIWWVCSGGAEKMKSAGPEEQYAALPKSNEGERTPAASEIERDLHRTFPNNDDINSEVGLNLLRRVLIAYSVRNPAVGYCQSMNFVAAVLLMHLDEERAFWVLSVLVEDILPAEYYSSTLIGSRVEQQVFQSCLAWKLPVMHNHFKNSGMLLEPVTCSWLLCLYINTLPLSVVLRVWDCLLWEGNIVLLRVGLAFCKIQERTLMKANDFVSIYRVLKDPFNLVEDEEEPREGPVDPNLTLRNADYVLATAFDKKWIGSLPRAKVEALRRGFKTVLIQNSKLKRAAQEEQLRIRQQTSSSVTFRPSEQSSASTSIAEPGDRNTLDMDAPDAPTAGRESRATKRATLQTSLDLESTILSNVSGSRASRLSSAFQARSSVKSARKTMSYLPQQDPGGVAGGDVLGGIDASKIGGLIEDDGKDYVAHDSDDDVEYVSRNERHGEQTIEEYIALLQRQRIEEIGDESVAENMLSQVLLAHDDEEDDEDGGKGPAKKDTGGFGGLMGSVFGMRSSCSVGAAKEADDDDDRSGTAAASTTESITDHDDASALDFVSLGQQSTAMKTLLEKN